MPLEEQIISHVETKGERILDLLCKTGANSQSDRRGAESTGVYSRPFRASGIECETLGTGYQGVIQSIP